MSSRIAFAFLAGLALFVLAEFTNDWLYTAFGPRPDSNRLWLVGNWAALAALLLPPAVAGYIARRGGFFLGLALGLVSKSGPIYLFGTNWEAGLSWSTLYTPLLWSLEAGVVGGFAGAAGQLLWLKVSSNIGFESDR